MVYDLQDQLLLQGRKEAVEGLHDTLRLMLQCCAMQAFFHFVLLQGSSFLSSFCRSLRDLLPLMLETTLESLMLPPSSTSADG